MRAMDRGSGDGWWRRQGNVTVIRHSHGADNNLLPLFCISNSDVSHTHYNNMTTLGGVSMQCPVLQWNILKHE